MAIPHKLRTIPGGGFVGRIEESIMASMALCRPLAPCDVYPRDNGQVRGHTLGHRADRGWRAGEFHSSGCSGRGSACFVRPFAHLPRSFLEDQWKGIAV